MEGKGRVAFALLCGLAVCCSVMYITADGESLEETVLKGKVDHHIGAGFDRHTPRSIESVDVKKTGMLITKTPDGRQRLLTFLNKVEANIAKEVAGRKADIAAVRTQMAKNFAANALARSKMKKMLLAKMAHNALIAKRELAKAMRWTQAKFAAAADLENRRNRATIKRSAHTRAIMRKNKKEAAYNLKMATAAHQRALSALASATNAKIRQTNKSISANAAQIKENAKKARQDLDKAMNRFDHKINNIGEEAKKGRSKLAAQMVAQDKKFRQYANNRVKEITAQTAAQFRKVRATMAKDRAHADMMLKHASARMDASLNANKALQDKRFAKTVADIAAAKAEAKARVNKAVSNFKVGILKLSAVVHHQSKKLNNRVTQLAGVVQNNKLEQAKVNRQVNAEVKRMIKTGNARYKEHLKKDKELRRLMDKNKAETASRMQKMANSFYTQISKIRKQMKRDRAHAERRLASKTRALFSTLAKNAEAQSASNKRLTAATRRARLDAAAALRGAKSSFTSRVAGLHKTVQRIERKHNGRLQRLSGVVAANAVKSAAGRKQLKDIAKANNDQLKDAVRDAIHKGEQRALHLEKKTKALNKKTRATLNNRITTEIGALAKNIHGQIAELNLQTKAARAQMKKEVLFAIKSAAKVAKDDLKKKVQWSEAQFSALYRAHNKSAKASAAARAALSAKIAANKRNAVNAIKDAVATQNRALLALRQETAKKIKKTNKHLTAHARQMEKNARAVSAQMKADTAQLNAKLEASRKAAVVQLSAVNMASARRYSKVIRTVEHAVTAARKSSDRRFGKAFLKMAQDRARADRNLASATNNLNDKLAKQSALADSRFRTTVKNIQKARLSASNQVASARRTFTTQLVSLTSKIKQQESRLQGDLATVTAMVISDRASQIRINNRLAAERKKIIAISNRRQSSNNRARGLLRKLMNENKRAASEETAALAKAATTKLAKARSQAAHYKRTFARDLTKSTRRLHVAIAKASARQATTMRALGKNLRSAQAATAGRLRSAKAMFKSRLNTLTNAVTANGRKFQKNLSRMTGVAFSWKRRAAKDRKNIRTLRSAMKADLDKSITRAVQLGEAKAKAVEQRSMASIASAKKMLLSTATAKIEAMADNVFKMVQGNRQKIADNYLSLKAYATTGADKITDYLAKGKGRNLSSVGDLLSTVASLSSVKATKATGEGFGSKTIPLLFSGKVVKIKGAVSKINGLVNEYVKVIAQVRARWPMGLGKYLIAKLEVAMQGTGALEVDKVSGKAGNYVFINGRAVGLSSKLSDFASLAVRMTNYEATLAKLTGKLSQKKKVGKVVAKPPQWQGN